MSSNNRGQTLPIALQWTCINNDVFCFGFVFLSCHLQGKKLPANIDENVEEGDVSDEDSADEMEDDCKLMNGDVSSIVLKAGSVFPTGPQFHYLLAKHAIFSNWMPDWLIHNFEMHISGTL